MSENKTNISLIVDTREGDLIKKLASKNIPFTVKQLDIGDIVFSTCQTEKDGVIEPEKVILVIERKSVADLKASICDGRSREQKARLMNGEINIMNILYLIEGNMNKKLTDTISGIPYDTLVGSLINTMLRDNIKIYKTQSMDETVEFLEKLLNKLTKDLDTFFITEQKDKTEKQQVEEYCSVIKHKKSSNLTSNLLYMSTLNQIPRVSSSISSSIVEKYPTLISLVKSYENISETERAEMLSDIKYKTASCERRIGPAISKKIYEFVYGI